METYSEPPISQLLLRLWAKGLCIGLTNTLYYKTWMVYLHSLWLSRGQNQLISLPLYHSKCSSAVWHIWYLLNVWFNTVLNNAAEIFYNTSMDKAFWEEESFFCQLCFPSTFWFATVFLRQCFHDCGFYSISDHLLTVTSGWCDSQHRNTQGPIVFCYVSSLTNAQNGSVSVKVLVSEHMNCWLACGFSE